MLERGGLRSGLRLFAFSASPVAQPLLDLLRSHSGFFAARQAPAGAALCGAGLAALGAAEAPEFWKIGIRR